MEKRVFIKKIKKGSYKIIINPKKTQATMYTNIVQGANGYKAKVYQDKNGELQVQILKNYPIDFDIDKAFDFFKRITTLQETLLLKKTQKSLSISTVILFLEKEGFTEEV